MRNALLWLLSSSSLALAACGPAAESGNGTAQRAQAELSAQTERDATARTVQPAGDAAAPVVQPSPVASARPPLTPEAERGEKGARNLLLGFARAVEAGSFGEASTMLGEAGRTRWREPDFERMFAGLSKRSVTASPGQIEGAAGSLYYTAPIAITGQDRDGRPVRFEGEAVLRRVNDVDGASAAQLRWHFERLTLDWTH